MTTTEPLYASARFTLEHALPHNGKLRHYPVHVVWEFYPTEPLAIRLHFGFNDDGGDDWYFSRSLLADAFEVDYTGHGDVTLGVFGDDIVISLSSPHGHATITGDARVAWHFLMETYAVVPPCLGTEHPTHVWCGECPVMGVVVDGVLGRIEREAMS